ncbi:MAG TPA: metabolite traffic protein EboE [Deinococcales bacterium]|nr:metabolite traffic protein EboE [Deinococcales bacterium]
MQAGRQQLTYCTNIHPGESWGETLAAIGAHAPELRRRLAPGKPFAIGPRLSGRASRELLEGDNLERFSGWLEGEGMHVALINGFPYGAFHGTSVKEEVHSPDWRDEERVEYTLRLARILARLLPEGMDGGISTNPLGYRHRFDGSQGEWRLVTGQVARVAAELARIRSESGKLIHLDVEPEPDGLLESGAELVGWWQDWLLPVGGEHLASALGVTHERAGELLREHVRVCLDTCHFAVGFEEPRAELARFAAAGLKVGRLQVSSALKVSLDGDRERVRQALAPFVESTYLHQVISRQADGSLKRYRDLPQALESLGDAGAREWRVHFHVPLFAPGFGLLSSTQAELAEWLSIQSSDPIAPHVEIETYTWDVLPGGLRLPLSDSIEREYRWVMEQLAARPLEATT